MTDAGDGLRLGKKLIFFCVFRDCCRWRFDQATFQPIKCLPESEAAFEPLSTRDKHADRCKSCSNAGGKVITLRAPHTSVHARTHAMAAAMTATRCARVANPRDGTGAPTPLPSLTPLFIQCESQEICHGGAEGSRPAPFAPVDASL